MHLESLNNTHTREQQLDLAWRVLRQAGPEHAMLMGDFNFSDGWTEQRKLDKCFVDVWRELNPLPSGKEECKDDPAQGAACLAAVRVSSARLLTLVPGYTMPKNAMWPAWRPDRIMLHSSLWRPVSIDIVGDEDMDPGCSQCHGRQHRVCTPSDHFALLAKFAWQGKDIVGGADTAQSEDPAVAGSGVGAGAGGTVGTGAGAGTGVGAGSVES